MSELEALHNDIMSSSYNSLDLGWFFVFFCHFVLVLFAFVVSYLVFRPHRSTTYIDMRTVVTE